MWGNVLAIIVCPLLGVARASSILLCSLSSWGVAGESNFKDLRNSWGLGFCSSSCETLETESVSTSRFNLRSNWTAACMVGFGTLVNFACAISKYSYFQGVQAKAPRKCDDVDTSAEDDRLDFVDVADILWEDDPDLASSCKKCIPSGLHSFVNKSEPLVAMMSKLPTNLRMLMLSA